MILTPLLIAPSSLQLDARSSAQCLALELCFCFHQVRNFSFMERSNHTVSEFILLGFTTDPIMQLILFAIFLIMYTLTVLGNTTLIVLICSNSRLHTPMYFFIGNLSFLDLWLSTVYTPKILVICVSEDKSISFAGCVAQFFFSAGLDYSECYLLAAMAYDH
ncbi:olfactory receptor [Cricetulus griseus]|nr:olfactory receptor [Cricetulus griseus]